MEILKISRWKKYSEKPERSKNIWLHHEDNTITSCTVIEKENGNEEAGYITNTTMSVSNHEPAYEGQKVVSVMDLKGGTISARFGSDNQVHMNREQAVELMMELKKIL